MTKINVNKTDFIKALTFGGAFAGKSKARPILDCVKIKVSNGKIKIVSSDGENAINKSIIADNTSENVVFCVNYKNLLSYIKLIPSDTFDICVNDNEVVVSHSRGKMSLHHFRLMISLY